VPVVLHRRAHPDAEPVRRVSDCVFRSSRVYRKLFVPMGARYQLDITTAVNDPVTAGRCWIINRSTQDFIDADLRNARRLQPTLALLDTIYSSAPTRTNMSAQSLRSKVLRNIRRFSA
jgi:hypothetical protein